LQGHDHPGGYFYDDDDDDDDDVNAAAKSDSLEPQQGGQGIYHVTLRGAVVTPPESTAFATVDFCEGRGLALNGHGRVRSKWMPFLTNRKQ